MKFKNLFIKGFGIFTEALPAEQRYFKFLPTGVNVVLGKNERGKTTLMEALLDTLYGIPGIRRDLRKPWGQSHTYAAVLEIENAGNTFRIERDFSTEQAELTMLDEGEQKDEEQGGGLLFRGNANPRSRSTQPRLYKSILEKHGIPPRDVMEQLAFVRQMEMEETISNEIRRLVTGGGGINYHAVISQLIGDYFKVTKINPWQAFNKSRPRELELIEQEIEELEAQAFEIENSRKEIIGLENEMEELKAEIEKLKAEQKDLLFSRSNLQEAITLNEKIKNNSDRLASLVKERDRLRDKHGMLDEYNEDIAKLEKLFGGREKEISDLCDELILTRHEKKELSHRHSSRSQDIKRMKADRDALEKEMYDKFAELTIFPPNFPELYRKYRKQKQEYQQGLEFYKEKRMAVEDMQKTLEGIRYFGNKGGDFEKKLEEYKDNKSEARVEIDFFKKKIKERKEMQAKVSEAWRMIRKNYPKMDELPEDIAERVKEFRKARQSMNLKQKQLDRLKKEHEEVRREIKKPSNFIFPLLGFVIGAVVGLITLKLPWIIVLGLLGGLSIGFLIWQNVRKLNSKKDRLEASIELLQDEVADPLPDPGIPKGIPDAGNHDKILERNRDYKAALRNIEKLNAKLTAMEPVEDLQHKIDVIDSYMVKSRAKLGLAADEDPAEILDEFRSYRKIDERIYAKRVALKERFPSLTQKELPDVPKELEELKGRIKQFEQAYPAIDGMPEFTKLEKQFQQMLILEGQIKELETLIRHSGEIDPYGKEKLQAMNREKEILDSLGPVIAQIGDNPTTIRKRLRHYQLLRKQARSLEDDLKKSGRLKDLEETINELSSKGVILEKKRYELLEKSPSISEFARSHPEDADLRLAELKERSSEIDRLLEEKQNRRNYCRVKVEQFTQPSEDSSQIREKLEEYSERAERLKLMRDGYKAAVDLMRESVHDFQSSHRKKLEEDISEIFSYLTGQKYARVFLDSDFEIRLEDKSRREIRKEAISSGARDQLYFAMRVALARSLSENVNIPFLLDDPFVNFDNFRMKMAKEILEKIALDHQVILFSHNRAFEKWGHVVCDLDKLGKA